MEGLLPFVYRAIVHRREEGHRAVGNPFLNDDPAAAAATTSYKRLATCDSGTYSRPATTATVVVAPFPGGAVVTFPSNILVLIVHQHLWYPYS
uniref:Uncharacterized protein n=1 Tax=Oryza brachyantha TaxID=4533 RepID=J3LMD3_ORYBR